MKGHVMADLWFCAKPFIIFISILAIVEVLFILWLVT